MGLVSLISSTPARFVVPEEKDWGYPLVIKLKSAWRIGRQAARRMKGQCSGSIINTGSVYGYCTGMMKADYNVSKVAAGQFTKNMALELGRLGGRWRCSSRSHLIESLTIY